MQIQENLKRQKALQVGRDPQVVMPGHTSILDIVHAMAVEGAGYAVLTDDNGLVEGILSERELLQKVVGVDGADQQLGTEAMSSNLSLLDREDTVAKAIHYMHRDNCRYVVIVDDFQQRRPIGVIQQMDIVRYLCEHFPDEILNLPPNPDQISEVREGA
jgi:signal-transduction protein with cAMP-binding, CBS, and nucleotidyltransferase domain